MAEVAEMTDMEKTDRIFAAKKNPMMANASKPDDHSFQPTILHHRGLAGWRYDCKSNYMITLVTEPRTSIFGRLQEWGVDRSEAGKAVYDSWLQISQDFPDVRATYYSVMPDHFHGILFFTNDGESNLDEVVQSFASNVERKIGRKIWKSEYRESICLQQGQLHRQIAYVMSNAGRRWVKKNNPELFRKLLGFRHWRLQRASQACVAAGGADQWNFSRFVRNPDSECWLMESGEEIAKPRKANCLQPAFCSENYRKPKAEGNAETSARQPPSVIDWTAVGNPFLLDSPLLISVRISTTIPEEELARVMAKICEKTSRGAVAVSPFISPGERAVKAAVLENGGSVVQLMAEGMSLYYKPHGRDFDFCSEGRLLQLTPFQPRRSGEAVREHYGKARFEWLNLAAANIADIAIGYKRVE